MRETQVWSLGQEDPLEEEMAIYSSILAWRIPWSLAGYSPWGSQKVRHDWVTKPSTHTNEHSTHVLCLVIQSSLTLCDPMDCSPPGSSVHGILQARILEWLTIPFSIRSSWPRDQTQVSLIAGRFFTIWTSRDIRMSASLLKLRFRIMNFYRFYIVKLEFIQTMI